MASAEAHLPWAEAAAFAWTARLPCSSAAALPSEEEAAAGALPFRAEHIRRQPGAAAEQNHRAAEQWGALFRREEAEAVEPCDRWAEAAAAHPRAQAEARAHWGVLRPQ